MSISSKAVLIENGVAIAVVKTTAKNGAMVSYGYTQLDDGGIHEVGRAKISRAKKYFNDERLMWGLGEGRTVYVNHANDGSC